MIKSKFHLKLAQLFDKIGNTKDAFHQLKLCVQQGVMDNNTKYFYEQFTRKLGAEQQLLPVSSQLETTILQIFEYSDDLALRYAILNHEM